MDILSTSVTQQHLADLGLPMAPPSQVDEIYETTRKNAIASLYYFSTVVLGWDKVAERPHLELCNFIQNIEAPHKRRKVLLIPRDCYKSTIGSKSFPLWILIQPEFCGIPGREHRILLASHSSVNAQKQIKSIRQQVERNRMLHWLFPELVPDFGKTTWTDTNLLFPRDGLYGEDTIECAGIDTHLVSRHYTIQIGDDLEDEKALLSPAVRERVKSWYKTSEPLFVDERTAYHLLIGTRWGIDDVYSEIFKNEADTYEVLVRPLEWDRQMLLDDLRTSKESNTPAVWNMDPDVWAPKHDQRYFLFPELFPEESCKRVRAKQGSFMYSMLYLNNPRDPALAEFAERDFQYFATDAETGDLILTLEDGSREIVPYDSLKRVMFWDPAMGESDAKKSSRNAIVVAGKDRKSRIFFLDAWADRKQPGFAIDRFIGFHQRYRVHRAAIEDVGFQRYLKYTLYQRQRSLGVSFPVIEQRPIGDKDARIRALIPFCESHLLFFKRGIGVRDLIEEMKAFPVFPTKDLVDASAACLELFGTATVMNDEFSRRRAQRDDTARLATRSSVTGY